MRRALSHLVARRRRYFHPLGHAGARPRSLAQGARFATNAGRENCSPNSWFPERWPYNSAASLRTHALRFPPLKEVIMTVKKNYVPCVDLKNLHIPLT